MFVIKFMSVVLVSLILFSCKEKESPKVPVPKNDLIKNLWYLSDGKKVGFLFRDDQVVEKLEDGVNLGVYGDYQFNKTKQEITLTSYEKETFSFKLGKSSQSLFYNNTLLRISDFKSKLKLNQSVWYLSKDLEGGYIFHKDGSYSCVKNKELFQDAGRCVRLANGSLVLVDLAGKEVHAFKFNKGKKIVIDGQEYVSFSNLELSREQHGELVRLLKPLKVTYKKSYSFKKLIEYVQKKKLKFLNARKEPNVSYGNFSKFSSYYSLKEELGGAYFYASKEADFGTKTKYGYFKEKDGDNYIFVYNIMKRGTKRGRYYHNGGYYYGHLYKCSVKTLSEKEISDQVLARIDPYKIRERIEVFNAKVDTYVERCDEALALLKKGDYLRGLSKVN